MTHRIGSRRPCWDCGDALRQRCCCATRTIHDRAAPPHRCRRRAYSVSCVVVVGFASALLGGGCGSGATTTSPSSTDHDTRRARGHRDLRRHSACRRRQILLLQHLGIRHGQRDARQHRRQWRSADRRGEPRDWYAERYNLQQYAGAGSSQRRRGCDHAGHRDGATRRALRDHFRRRESIQPGELCGHDRPSLKAPTVSSNRPGLFISVVILAVLGTTAAAQSSRPADVPDSRRGQDASALQPDENLARQSRRGSRVQMGNRGTRRCLGHQVSAQGLGQSADDGRDRRRTDWRLLLLSGRRREAVQSKPAGGCRGSAGSVDRAAWTWSCSALPSGSKAWARSAFAWLAHSTIG